MDNSVILHDRNTPLASCEARARLALERGELSQAAYQSLIGITAEVLLTKDQAYNWHETEANSTHTEAAATLSSIAMGTLPSTPEKRKQVTPCDTPPVSRREEASLQAAAKSPQITNNFNFTTFHNNKGGGMKTKVQLQFSDQSHHEEQGSRSHHQLGSLPHDDDGNASSELHMLETLREQGFSLSERAERFFAREACEQNNTDDDQRLLDFADTCLKMYPLSSCPKTKEDDMVWQTRLGLVVPQEAHEPYHLPIQSSNSNNDLSSGLHQRPVSQTDSDKARWDLRFEELLQYKRSSGHCNVPFRYSKNKSLGGWVQKQRDFNKKGKLTTARYEQLDAINFSWILENRKIPKINNDKIHSYNDLWDFRFNSLVEFKCKHGHCHVPYRWKEDAQLGRWVQNQREFYKRGTLRDDRLSRLEELGFAWSLKKKVEYKNSTKSVASWAARQVVG